MAGLVTKTTSVARPYHEDLGNIAKEVIENLLESSPGNSAAKQYLLNLIEILYTQPQL